MTAAMIGGASFRRAFAPEGVPGASVTRDVNLSETAGAFGLNICLQ
jgi:hypothetical protein